MSRLLPPIAANAHREQVAKLPLIEELAGILLVLQTGWCPIYAKPRPSPGSPTIQPTLSQVVHNKPRVVGWRELTKDDAARYSLLLKSVEAALRKVLPDLKSIEVNDRSDEKKVLTDQELAQRISGLLTQVRSKTGQASPAASLPARPPLPGPSLN